MAAPKLTPEIQACLFHETDARFWAQSGYAPGRALDPKNPTDAAMIPLWNSIYKNVHAEWAAGKLVTTYDHPIVTGLITEAAHEFANAAQSIGLALATPASDPITKNAHAADAEAAHAAAQAATAKAATYQPPSASPAIAAQAAHAVAAQVAASPAPLPPAAVLDALQSSHAPAQAASVQAQTPAPDAPKPPATGAVGKAVAVAGGCFAILMMATLLNKTGGSVAVRGSGK